MAVRPLTFGVRLRENGRTVRVRQEQGKGARRYVVEDDRPGRATRRRGHSSIHDAVRDLASTWRARLH